jgi:hypothetical protein
VPVLIASESHAFWAHWNEKRRIGAARRATPREAGAARDAAFRSDAKQPIQLSASRLKEHSSAAWLPWRVAQRVLHRAG